jgi:hypothetical protein
MLQTLLSRVRQMARALRIGNCSGFYGDRFAAMREMLEGGDLDVLTGDYLAELTMLLLWRSRSKDPSRGYAATFVRQLEECLGLAWERGVRIVANAGGLNPAGCADAVREIASRLGLRAFRSPTRRSPRTPTSAAGAFPPPSTPAHRSSWPGG